MIFFLKFSLPSYIKTSINLVYKMALRVSTLFCLGLSLVIVHLVSRMWLTRTSNCRSASIQRRAWAVRRSAPGDGLRTTVACLRTLPCLRANRGKIAAIAAIFADSALCTVVRFTFQLPILPARRSGFQLPPTHSGQLSETISPVKQRLRSSLLLQIREFNSKITIGNSGN